MARGIEGNEIATPKPSLQKSTSSQSSNKNQKTILGFFQRKAAPTPSQTSSQLPKTSASPPLDPHKADPAAASVANLTPAPSSEAGDLSSPIRPNTISSIRTKDKPNGLPSPVSSAGRSSLADRNVGEAAEDQHSSSPSRKARRRVNYAESSDENDDDEEDVFKPTSGNRRANKRRRVVADESDEEFGANAAAEDAMYDDDDMDDFIVADDSDEEPVNTKKRKRSSKPAKAPSASRVSPPSDPVDDEFEDVATPSTSTARQWEYDADNPAALDPNRKRHQPAPRDPSIKQKAHETSPQQRYPWLATILDKDRRPPTHPEYDPRTIYIPPMAWNNFSPFEKQYWEIKQNLWDAIVFFKKGKFYELYEKDADIGHQLFDFKRTDRVNMSMVGVPEASLDQWVTQFVAKGYRVAQVDQMESQLAKEMRERDDEAPSKAKKGDVVIRRELACVLTAGTLVDAGMMQGDMSTFCVAIKEVDRDNLPAFGIAFVDTATAQFHLTGFVDDADMTKFETFVAQIRPGELVLEKSCLSSRALRIIKNNTSVATITNNLKPGKEFWPADMTAREIDASGYFVNKGEGEQDAWPKALQQAKDNELVLSAFGGLVSYLRQLKIDRELVSLGNITWYDPVRRGTTLVLDGQSLINLEIFANTFDGGSEGTLFAMLNRCVTPFGKRMLRQWVCHPLSDAKRINARLDAVDALNANNSVTDRFTSSLTKMPDLERLISRIHASRCKPQDFVRVLEGFEQIEYTMTLLEAHGKGDGLIGQLISSMPDLAPKLKFWKTAFDKNIARQNNLLVPSPGVEDDFDAIKEKIDECEAALDEHLQKARKQLKSTAIVYKDIGKEIYQLEVPAKVKDVPANWSQMSATAKVKRYYNSELRRLVRDLQEARETQSQIVKEISGRFCARFDVDYIDWLAAVKIIAQLDCLISLAQASSSLGTPSCRPEFVDDDGDGARSVIDLRDLRHPTMLTTVADFIPNDVQLGGQNANLHLLTGANAAGKSTVLRMTCIAVILAQLGCHVPASSARLSPRDRIMSRLGANDNILQQQSTFFVELAETKKILSEATPRSLVILDELGRGTSSVDGLAVAESVLHHVAGNVGCLGFFATHYHSLAQEFQGHPEVRAKRMAIEVDDAARKVMFLYKLEDGVAEGSFGMHCASMCGIPSNVIDRANEAAGMWEHSGRVQERIQRERSGGRVGLGWLSDISWALKEADGEAKDSTGDGELSEGASINLRALDVLARAIEAM